MFSIRSKLASILQPWLVTELDLELKLGFLRSHGTAKNLHFNISALNQLISESNCLYFKDVRIDKFCVGFSPWSVPALTVKVHGLHVILTARETIRSSNYSYAMELKEVLSIIDPEGIALHDVIEKISAIDSTRNQLTNSLMNIILQQCQLQMHDIHLEVQLPEEIGCIAILKMKEIRMGNSLPGSTCLVGGLIGCPFVSKRESSLVVSASDMEIELSRGDYVNSVFHSSGFVASIKLKDFQLQNLEFRIPQLNFAFCPVDLPILLTFDILLPKEVKPLRNGRELWNIAARKVGYLNLNPRSSFCKVVSIARLWLRYVHAYESLLLLLGYSEETELEKSAAKMLMDKKFCTRVKHEQEVISEIENGLPVEALARARRVARYRAAMHTQCIQSTSEASFGFNEVAIFIKKILSLLSFLWTSICCIFLLVINVLSLKSVFNRHEESDGSSIVTQDFSPLYCVVLGQIIISFHPINPLLYADSGNAKPRIGIGDLDLHSFSLVLDALFFVYIADNTRNSLSLSCGDLKVNMLSSSINPLTDRNLRAETNSQSTKGHKKEKIHESSSVVWSEGAALSNKVVTGFRDSRENAGLLHMESYLDEMWSDWKGNHKKLEGGNPQSEENPMLLFETKKSLRPDYGIWRCCLTMGKLNFELSHTSIASVALLVWQIKHTLCKRDSANSSLINQVPKQMELEDYFESYTNEMKMVMHRIIQEKNIQVAVAIAGPTIRLLPEEDEFLGLKKQFHPANQGDILAFELQNIEFVVWPTQKVKSAEVTAEQRRDDAGTSYHRVKEGWLIDILKEYSNVNYISHGQIIIDCCLRINGSSAYYENTKESHRREILLLKPIIMQSSFCKEYLDSFATAVSTLSTSVCGMANGITVLSYMDELLISFQVVQCILSTVSCNFASLDSVCGINFEEIVGSRNRLGEDIDWLTQAYKAKGAALILKGMNLVFDATLDFGTLDMVLDDSRKNSISEENLKISGALGSKPFPDGPEHGLGFSIQHSHANISLGEGIWKVVIDVSGIKSVIFSFQNLIGECGHEYESVDLLLPAHNCLYEFSLSDCTLDFWVTLDMGALSSGGMNDVTHGSTLGTKSSNAINAPRLNILTDGSNIEPHTFNPISRREQPNSSTEAPSKNYDLLINVEVGDIFISETFIKKALIEEHQSKRLQSSVSTDGGFRRISWSIQGGLIVLETAALAMFLQCFRAYVLHITNISCSIASCAYLSSGEDISTSSYPSKASAERTDYSFLAPETCNASPELKSQLLEALMIRLSQFSLILVAADGSGGIWELILEADFHLNLEFTSSSTKLLFDSSHLTVLSKSLLCSCLEQSQQTKVEIQLPHFSSVTNKNMSSRSSYGDTFISIRDMASVPTASNQTYSSGVPHTRKEKEAEKDMSGYSRINHANCIVEHVSVTASLMIEKTVTAGEVGLPWLKSDWVGSGSVSGLEFTTSLSQIQMVLTLVAPLSTLSNAESAGNSKENQQSRNQELNSSSVITVPDGSVVAIQDVHQHMYFAVESLENKYHLTGTIHYSLVGERALFLVKYCTRKRWGLQVSWFTLTSLHAKSSSGEPFRLNYQPGSGFVDISSTTDYDEALWKILPYKPESFEDDNDQESYSQSSKNIFYLVNKKCDSAVAFIDGVPEFVEKPGNQFKIKVFQNISPRHDALSLFTPSWRSDEATDPQNRDFAEGEISSAENLSNLNIRIDKVSLTIVDEVPDANDKFPLLQVCISDTGFTVQVLSSKLRLISTFTVAILYFDAQINIWREFVQPVEMYVFYRSKFVSQGSQIVSQGAPVRFYFRMNPVDIYLTELSLDIILFLVGKLNIAGPYAVQSSRIFANCCKVENQSGLNLLCHFYDNQDATVGGKQSAFIFLRNAAVASQLPENSPFVSIQLAVPGAFSTSPIHVSLLSARILSWRTRVVSLRDSGSFPGAFVVVEISKKTEDGLSIVVSPLLRIHNETGYSMELRFRRPQQEEAESASLLLRSGHTVDDSMAVVDAINLNGGSKKALMSLSLGNFLFSFRPEIDEGFEKELVSVEWSEDMKGGKAVRLSGVFDKLSYKFRKTLGVESVKYDFSTVHCSLKVKDVHLTDLHFLIQTIGRDVPVIRPDNLGGMAETRTSPVALQEQKEIFLLPTVKVSNFLQSDIHVLITENHPDVGTSEGGNHIGKQATIPSGSSACLYGNPAIIYFTVTLAAFGSRCKPVNSGDWVKKLHKQKKHTHYLDIDLDFGGGKYFATLRLLRGDRGILEAAVFTSYTLCNESDLILFCFMANQKPISREEADRLGSSLSPDRGTVLPPKSKKSWFLKSNKVKLISLENKASAAPLDLDALSRFTELCLEVDEGAGIKCITKLGVSLSSYQTQVVPSQIVSLSPRYVVSNESHMTIIVRQCYLEDDRDGIVAVNSKERATLHMKSGPSKRRVIGAIDSLLKKHKNTDEDSIMYIQFCLDENGWSWSGPICVASLGRFFLKFRRSLDFLGHEPNLTTQQENKLEFAVVQVVEEGSTLVLQFQRPLNISLPYRIENSLRGASMAYYQKDSSVPEILEPGSSVNYIWDDITLPHKLVVHIPDMRLTREINMEKVRAWKSLLKVRQNKGLALQFPLDKKLGKQKKTIRDESRDLEMLKVGYEVYTDGATRVLRIAVFPDTKNEDEVFQPRAKIELKVTNFSIHLLEHGKQDEDQQSSYSPVVVARLRNINVDSMFTEKNKYNQIKIQSLHVDEKWAGAPFAAIIRRDRLNYPDAKGNMLQILVTLLPSNSNVKQVRYASIVLQPIDLNIDEETLMKLVPFWRTSLSDSKAPSQQFYFKHFEIHPIKIVASFLPGSSDSNYSSAQETVRTLLHNVIKVPSVKNMNVELNGVLVTHALVTARELVIKCAQHYSWYGMRAIYIAKGSPLLPPAFVSIFDDSASSSLDVFFDPASGLVNLPGLTIGMFKVISKCVNKKGFSGTKRYFGDLGKTVRAAGSNVLFAAVTEVSDCILKGAEANGFTGMINGFHQGILKLAMEPSLLGTAVMEGGPDRKIKLDHSPGVDELYIEGYLQAMLDALYKQEYLRVRVIDNQVILKNLPPNTSLISEIMDRVNSFLMSKGLLKGDLGATSHSFRHLRGVKEWKIGPTILTLWEHLFVSFTIRILRKQAGKLIEGITKKEKSEPNEEKAIVPASIEKNQGLKLNLKWGVGKFLISGMIAYLDGRLCRKIPNAVVRRIVSGFLLSFLDKTDQ